MTKRKAQRTKLIKGKRAKGLPKTTPLSQARAAKLMEPYLPDLQKAVDEQSRADLGIAAGPEAAKRFRKKIAEMLDEKEKP